MLGGFTQGGTLTVDFTGSDIDGDGQITAAAGYLTGNWPNEMTALSATWSGNAAVPAFTLSIADPYLVAAELVYLVGAPDVWSAGSFGIEDMDLNSNMTLAATGLIASSIVGIDAYGFVGLSSAAGTFVDVAPVPEPASLVVLGSALAGLGLLRRRS